MSRDDLAAQFSVALGFPPTPGLRPAPDQSYDYDIPEWEIEEDTDEQRLIASKSSRAG